MKSNLMKFTSLGMIAAIILMAIVLPGPQTVKADPQFGFNWQAFYWNNPTLNGNPTIGRTDPAIQPDNFSARWTGTFNFAAGTYTFKAGAEDGIRAAVDGAIIIDRFTA